MKILQTPLSHHPRRPTLLTTYIIIYSLSVFSVAGLLERRRRKKLYATTATTSIYIYIYTIQRNLLSALIRIKIDRFGPSQHDHRTACNFNLILSLPPHTHIHTYIKHKHTQRSPHFHTWPRQNHRRPPLMVWVHVWHVWYVWWFMAFSQRRCFWCCVVCGGDLKYIYIYTFICALLSWWHRRKIQGNIATHTRRNAL